MRICVHQMTQILLHDSILADLQACTKGRSAVDKTITFLDGQLRVHVCGTFTVVSLSSFSLMGPLL